MPDATAPAPNEQAIAALQAATGHTFKHPQLLLDALTHRSFAYESTVPGVRHNERLEFLGDAVLQLISSDLLFRLYPDASEGELSYLRAALVRASALAGFARAVRVGPHLRLGRGEEATGGLRATRHFLEPLLRQEAARAIAGKRIKDDKSRLQERAQAQLGVTPSYRVVSESGPSHDRTFVVEVLLGERAVAHGEGRSKRQAEQEAARAALTDPGWQVDE